MQTKSKVWYEKGQAKNCPVLSCYALNLKLFDGTVVDGYYYCGQFYHRDEKITDSVSQWMIPQEGESVHSN